MLSLRIAQKLTGEQEHREAHRMLAANEDVAELQKQLGCWEKHKEAYRMLAANGNVAKLQKVLERQEKAAKKAKTSPAVLKKRNSDEWAERQNRTGAARHQAASSGIDPPRLPFCVAGGCRRLRFRSRRGPVT